MLLTPVVSLRFLHDRAVREAIVVRCRKARPGIPAFPRAAENMQSDRRLPLLNGTVNLDIDDVSDPGAELAI